MLPPLPILEDYGISKEYGFLPPDLPLERLPDPYYNKWEAIVLNLQGLILTKRLRGVIDHLPVLSTAGLEHDSEWRRAYSLLCFMAHGYIWGGDSPSERLPASISIPLLDISSHLEVPPVATYAAVCLWNFRALFDDESIDSLENLTTLTTFTGSIDESWFYLVSVAIEARGGPMLSVMLRAIEAARQNDSKTVTKCLQRLAETIDSIVTLLQRMNDGCDPHAFFHRIRPFLAGSKNMAEAGLPHGVIYEDGSGNEQYRQYCGGSNAQSSLLQFFDIVLGIEHRPTGDKKDVAPATHPPSKNDFLQEMRQYMPGGHRRFLEDLTKVANIRDYVESHRSNAALTLAYDSCLAMLRALRDKHISIVSRYIIIRSRESRSLTRAKSPEVQKRKKIDLASASTAEGEKKDLKGTGGTTLVSFLKQARDETGEGVVNGWVKRAMLKRGVQKGGEVDEFAVKSEELVDEPVKVNGLAGTWIDWTDDDNAGGICNY